MIPKIPSGLAAFATILAPAVAAMVLALAASPATSQESFALNYGKVEPTQSSNTPRKAKRKSGSIVIYDQLRSRTPKLRSR